MEFNVETFLSGEVSATAVENLKKVELVEIVRHLSAETQIEGLKKAQVKATVIQLLTEKGLLKAVTKSREMSQMEYDLEIKKLEMQREREEREESERRELREEKERERQFQREEKEREFERQKELAEKERQERERKAKKEREVKLQELKMKLEQEEKERSVWTKNDVASCICLVSKFDEESVDKFFLHFEKIAESVTWPKDL